MEVKIEEEVKKRVTNSYISTPKPVEIKEEWMCECPNCWTKFKA
jgi:hypothetical protein